MFSHRLALALGRTVSQLLAELSPAELRDWQLYDRQAGLPDVAAQWQRATAISVAAAAGGSSVDPAEVMPIMAWDNRPATAQQIAEVFSGR